MTLRVGICSVCNLQVKLVTSWNSVLGLAERVAMFHLGNTDDLLSHACSGSRKPTYPTTAQRKRQRTQLELIRRFRSHAEVALDAWIEQREYPRIELAALLEVARRYYGIYYPNHVARNVTRAEAILGRTRNPLPIVDLYCTFCGVLLHQSVKVKRINAYALDRHAVECALKHLVFELAPMPPTTKRLPDEYVAADSTGDAP